jgi:hypothetical protein
MHLAAVRADGAPEPVRSFGIFTDARFRARSTSQLVAAHGGCTYIPLAAVRVQEDETILEDAFSGHAKVRVYPPDPPGPISSWKN